MILNKPHHARVPRDYICCKITVTVRLHPPSDYRTSDMWLLSLLERIHSEVTLTYKYTKKSFSELQFRQDILMLKRVHCGPMDTGQEPVSFLRSCSEHTVQFTLHNTAFGFKLVPQMALLLLTNALYKYIVYTIALHISHWPSVLIVLTIFYSLIFWPQGPENEA